MTVERSLLAVRNLRIARDDVASAPAVADTFFCGLGGFDFEIKADPEATDPPRVGGAPRRRCNRGRAGGMIDM